MTRIRGVVLLSATLVSISCGRVFTNAEGRKMEGELISVTEKNVIVKSLKNGKSYTIKILDLSAEDQKIIAGRREELRQITVALAGAKRSDEVRRKVVGYAKKNLGKKVGNGECWTLADVAYKFAKIQRPGKDQRVWGRLVDWENEDFLPGDVLELQAAGFSDGNASGPKHTAIVMKQGRRRGEMVVYHQNWGRPGKVVSLTTFDLTKLVSGKALVYRYGK